ncbi:MAG: hypothetical protein V1670_03165 [Candidatus Omnitrophota bacterium]
MAYFNKKAQSLTELASFGSILLLVLSFILSYGMRLNYQQDAQMRVFRMAMTDAYSNVTRPDATSSIALLEDKHTPDPRDRFGIGSIAPAQSGAQITWGNTINDPYEDFTDYAQIKYMINGREEAYDTEAFATIHQSMYPGGFYADVLDQRVLVAWGEVTCYQPTLDSPKLARIEVDENKFESISSIYITDANGNMIAQNLPIIAMVPPGAENGDAIQGFGVRTPQGGAINPYYMQLNQSTGEFDSGNNPIIVTPENMQGLLPYDTDTETRRDKDTLGLDETSRQWKSTDKFDLNATITHKVRTNSSGTDLFITRLRRFLNNKVWTTGK